VSISSLSPELVAHILSYLDYVDLDKRLPGASVILSLSSVRRGSHDRERDGAGAGAPGRARNSDRPTCIA
jgi:hypothetical protein